MTTATAPPPTIRTLADLLDRLGSVPLDRIQFHPYPGTATEADVVALDGTKRLCELVDGVLVEKGLGFAESVLAVAIAAALRAFVSPRRLGVIVGADATMRLFPGLVRIPDVAFVAMDRLPGGHIPRQAVPDVVPNLAVEVLSRSNTAAEMTRKLGEYFDAGVELVWLVDPRARTVAVYTAADQFRLLRPGEALDGGSVLPGFTLSLQVLFAALDI